MCLNPISIPSQSKYVSFSFRDRYLNQFSCGHCIECQLLKSSQWSFRSYYEFESLPDSGYVMFDTLTYRNKDLPHLSDFWNMLSKSEDYPCFNRLHLRKFFQSLRQRVIRAGYAADDVRWYYCCEYGTTRGRSHRPHYHLMLFCKNVDPFWLSCQISNLWKYGRTDGLPYKSKEYIYSHNIIRRFDLAGRLRTISYITKYLQKSCKFQSVLNNRVNNVMQRLSRFAAPDDPFNWLDSEYARRERLKLLRMVNQFHRTSQHFGEYALQCFDYIELVRYSGAMMPDHKRVAKRVPLSTFYKRKLFYEQVTVNGSRYWQLNELGRQYMDDRRSYLHEMVSQKLRCLALDNNMQIDSVELSNYLLDQRGFLKVNADPSQSIEDRFNNVDLYNYSSCSDKLQFNKRGLTPFWLGDSQQGYKTSTIPKCISFASFLSNMCFFDERKEEILSKLYHRSMLDAKKRNEVLSIKQRVLNVAKMFS